MDSLEKGNKSDEDSEMPEEEEVDPRIQGELENLNQSTDDINRWETELEDVRQRFRAVLVEATVKLDEVVKKIGKPVEDSKPYWEARRVARQAQLEAQRAAQDYQRAIEVVRVAKETISLAEERLLEEDSRQFDSAWQEMLNHATQRVMEAEQTKARSELVHSETAAKYDTAIGHVKQLEKKLKRTINKSRPYFELKAKYYLELEQLKKKVDERQVKLTLAKGGYRTALRNLEKISDEIHQRRRSSAMGPRGRGVGSECDSIAGDDIANFKMESDGISMVSVSFDDENCNGGMSEEDSETQSTCSVSPSLTASPQDPLHPCPSSPSSSSSPSSPRPGNLDLPGPVSLCSFSHLSPFLGPRSECSGASSPECDLERGDRAEGAEGEQDDAVNAAAAAKKRTNLESRFGQLSLEQAANSERDTFAAAQRPPPAPAHLPPALLVNGV